MRGPAFLVEKLGGGDDIRSDYSAVIVITNLSENGKSSVVGVARDNGVVIVANTGRLIVLNQTIFG